MGAGSHDGPVWGRTGADGFLPGIMWIFHKRALAVIVPRDSRYWMEHAIQYTKTLEPRKHDREDARPRLSFFCPPITAGINSRAIRNSKRY